MTTADPTWNSHDPIGFLRGSAVVEGPSCGGAGQRQVPHTSKVVRAACKGPTKKGIYLDFLPPYSQELNQIEPVFRQIKH